MSSLLIYTIDDDTDFNQLLKMALKPYNISLKTHETAAEFTKSFKEKKPDLCILDLNLNKNGGEGFQLIKAIRNVIGKDLTIWAMSRRSGEEDVKKALIAGANDFLPKPLDDQLLCLKLGQLFPENKNFMNLVAESVNIDPIDHDTLVKVFFELKHVGMDYLELTSDTLFGKNQNIKLTGEILKEIFNNNSLLVKVIETHQCDDSYYKIKVHRNYSQEEYLSLRKWLFDQIKDQI